MGGLTVTRDNRSERRVQNPCPITHTPSLVHAPLTVEGSCLPATQLHLHAFRMKEGRCLSVGSDEMSISSGPTVSDIHSTPSITAVPKCCTCKSSDTMEHNPLIRCACRRRYHAACHKPFITAEQQRYLLHVQLSGLFADDCSCQTSWQCAVCVKKGRAGSGKSEKSRPSLLSGARQPPPWRVNGFVAETPTEGISKLGGETDFDSGVRYPNRMEFGERTHSGQIEFLKELSSLRDGAEHVDQSPSNSAEAMSKLHCVRELIQSERGIPLRAASPSGLLSLHTHTKRWHHGWRAPDASPLGFIREMSENVARVPGFEWVIDDTAIPNDDPVKQPETSGPPSCVPIQSDVQNMLNTELRTDPGVISHDSSRPNQYIANSDTSTADSFNAHDRQSSATSYEHTADPSQPMDSKLGHNNTHLSASFMSDDTDSDLSSVPSSILEEVLPETTMQRPTDSFMYMITTALLESPNHELDGREVLTWIRDHYVFYRDHFTQKTLYSNVHALLSIGKRDGDLIKHEPPPGVRARCKYSFSPHGLIKLRKLHGGKSQQQQTQCRPHSLLTPQASTSSSSTPQPKAYPEDHDDDGMLQTAGDVGYCVRNRTTSKFRIAAKNGMPEWDTLSVVEIAGHNKIKLAAGDMVKVLLENTNDAFGKIFEMRRVSDEITAVAILWYSSTNDLQQIISHRNRREWPQGYKYLLSNWVDVINLKAIECKAESSELKCVFPGPKMMDCTGGTRIIRETSAKEVAWAMSLLETTTELSIPQFKGTRAAHTIPSVSTGAQSAVLSHDIKHDLVPISAHSKRKCGRSISPGGINIDVKTPEVLKHIKQLPEPSTEPLQSLAQTESPKQQCKKQKMSHINYLPSATYEREEENEAGFLQHPNKLTNNTSPQYASYIIHANTSNNNIELGNSRLKIDDILAAKDAEIEKLAAIVRRMQDGGSSIAEGVNELPTSSQQKDGTWLHARRSGATQKQVNISHQLNVDLKSAAQHCPTPVLATELQILRAESDHRSRELARLNSVVNTQSAAIQKLRKELDEGIGGKQPTRDSRWGWSLGKSMYTEELVYDQKLSNWDDIDNDISTGYRVYQDLSPLPNDAAHLKSQKKKFFGKPLPPRQFQTGLVKYGETPSEAFRAFLGIPKGHILLSRNGTLAYRDDTRVNISLQFIHSTSLMWAGSGRYPT